MLFGRYHVSTALLDFSANVVPAILPGTLSPHHSDGMTKHGQINQVGTEEHVALPIHREAFLSVRQGPKGLGVANLLNFRWVGSNRGHCSIPPQLEFVLFDVRCCRSYLC